MSTFDPRAVARWRLTAQHLSPPPAPSAPSVVAGLLAVQAENHAQASWAVATRTGPLDRPAFDRLFDDGAILRTHVLRSTWHFVAPDDIRWLVELTAPRVRRTYRQHQQNLGLDDATLDHGAQILADELAGGASLTRDELAARLTADGIDTAGQRLGVIAAHAELAALICSGPVRDGRQTYALLDERAPRARRLDRDEALAEVALRYFTGHGPATERDLAYWATLTLTDVRTGIAAVADRLGSFELGGRTYWFGRPPPDDDAPDPRAHLLQILDELYRGYQDSRWTIDVDGLVPRGREPAIGMVVVDGQMVGHMRRSIGSDAVRFDVTPFRPLADDERDAVQDAADRYGRFLRLPATVTVGTPS